MVLSLPKLTHESAFSLKDALQNLGMTDAFNPDRAASGMDENRDRYVGCVLHKPFISVDGQGTEAAVAWQKAKSYLTKSRTWSIFLAVEATTMKKTVNVYEAKTHFSQLLDRVMAGEEIVIGKAGKPVARLVPIVGAATARFAGSAAGAITIAPDFDAPLPDEVLGGFEA